MNQREKFGKTALFLASERGHVAAVKVVFDCISTYTVYVMRTIRGDFIST